MNKTEPTAGEWTTHEGFVDATEHNRTTRIGLAMRTGYLFSDVRVPHDEANANARLFAASKDLLSALQDAEFHLADLSPDHSALDDIRAAIAKAKGEA